LDIADSKHLVVSGSAPARPPINLRFAIPFFPRWIFFTLIVGSEKRSRSRIRAEREAHPVNTWGNYAAVTMVMGITLTAALFAALVVSTL
jgi:hypothetical protein